jgi:hypothetical protein
MSTPHSSRFARLAYELSTLPSIGWLPAKSSRIALRVAASMKHMTSEK